LFDLSLAPYLWYRRGRIKSVAEEEEVAEAEAAAAEEEEDEGREGGNGGGGGRDMICDKAMLN